jgi:hypothetical protein
MPAISNPSLQRTAKKLRFLSAAALKRLPAYAKQSEAAPEWYDVASPHWRGKVGRANAL